MTRLYRPYISLKVRVQVAERQVRQSGSILWPLYLSSLGLNGKLAEPWSQTHRLRVLLNDLFPDGQYQLDHDPALELRPQRRRAGKVAYTPDANDPDHLIYRSTSGHLQKTTGRKPGAEKTATSKGSDVWLGKKFRKLEGKTKHRPKAKIPSRPFQKGKRKLHNVKKSSR
jgi:hypothetical protein